MNARPWPGRPARPAEAGAASPRVGTVSSNTGGHGEGVIDEAARPGSRGAGIWTGAGGDRRGDHRRASTRPANGPRHPGTLQPTKPSTSSTLGDGPRSRFPDLDGGDRRTMREGDHHRTSARTGSKSARHGRETFQGSLAGLDAAPCAGCDDERRRRSPGLVTRKKTARCWCGTAAQEQARPSGRRAALARRGGRRRRAVQPAGHRAPALEHRTAPSSAPSA